MKSLAALYPSQYRDYVKQWKRQYAENPEVFHETGFLRLAQYARKVGGSSKAVNGVVYRIFLPFVLSALPESVETALVTAGFSVQNAMTGLCYMGSRTFRIGKVLNELKAEKALREFNDMSLDKNVCCAVVSRHPYDIAGMSTGRDWISCTKIGTIAPGERIQQEYEAAIKAGAAIFARLRSLGMSDAWINSYLHDGTAPPMPNNMEVLEYLATNPVMRLQYACRKYVLRTTEGEQSGQVLSDVLDGAVIVYAVTPRDGLLDPKKVTAPTAAVLERALRTKQQADPLWKPSMRCVLRVIDTGHRPLLHLGKVYNGKSHDLAFKYLCSRVAQQLNKSAHDQIRYLPVKQTEGERFVTDDKTIAYLGLFADVGVSLQRVISRGITFGSLPVIRKYIHGERGAVVLQNALLKCAELRLKKQPACLSDVLQTYFSQE